MNKWILLAAVVVALLILWRMSSRSVPPVSITDTGMILRNGSCRMHLPLKRVDRESFTADVLTIRREIVTFPNGYRVVDEKVSMPENYAFGKALSAVVRAVFGLKDVETLDENGKMAIFEGKRDGQVFRVLAVFKGKADLELLYPLNESFFLTIKRCLIDKSESEDPTVVNHVVDSDGAGLPLSRWDQNLFDLEILINKDM